MIIRNLAKSLPTAAAVALGVTLTVGLAGSVLAARQLQQERMINLALTESMLAQKMGKELLLAALDVDRQRNMKSLEASRALFDRTLIGLREGDVELGLPGSDDPKFLKGLEKVEIVWGSYDALLGEAMETGEITPRLVGAVSDLTFPMFEAMEEAVVALEEQASDKGLISVIDVAIKISGQQRMLTQKLTREFLMIAFGQDVEKNRTELKKSMALFDNTLAGLMSGDPALRLVSAPTPEIKAQLRKVGRIWDELSPQMQAALEGNEVNPEAVQQIARLNMPLLKAMNMAVFMYEAL